MVSTMSETPRDEEATSPSNKKSYPFGTPNHGKFSYSSFAHLPPTNRDFAMQLAASTGEVGVVRTERKSPMKQRAAPILDDLPEAEEGVAPCIRPECRDVIRDIYDRQAKNEAERDDIIQECEKMIQIHQQLEEETLMIDDDNKRIILEGNLLEESYQTLQSKYAKCKAIKIEKETERDELNSKLMLLDLEKQRLIRRNQEIQAALSDIMWKGTTNVVTDDHRSKTTLHIFPADAKSFQEADNVSPSKYHALARDDLLDFNERPKTVPVLPDALTSSWNQFGGRSSRSVRSMRSQRDHDDRSMTSHSYLRRSSGLSLNGTSSASFRGKGYTPTARSKTAGSNLSTFSTTSLATELDAQTILDPVFFKEKARSSWGRSSPLGKLRVSSNPPGYKRKLLTSLGHPRVFGDEYNYRNSAAGTMK